MNYYGMNLIRKTEEFNNSVENAGGLKEYFLGRDWAYKALLCIIFLPFILIFNRHAFVVVELSIWPCLFLGWCIYRSLRNSNISLEHMVRLGITGAFKCTLIILLAETLALPVLNAFVQDKTHFHSFCESFFIAALIEEGVKMYFLYKTTWKLEEFKNMSQAVAYSAALALGYAAAENILYLADSSIFGAADARILFATPAHCIDGAIMGVFFGCAKLKELCGDSYLTDINLKRAFLAAFMTHGIYDYLAFTNIGLFEMYVTVLFLSICSWVKGKIQKEDIEIVAPVYQTYENIIER